jgi:hypothetical protein
MFTAICVSVLLCIIVYYLLRKLVRNLTTGNHGNTVIIPGPRGYPLIGNTLDVRPETLHLKLTEWSTTFGDVFAIEIMNKTIVVLNSTAAIREALLTTPYDTIFASRFESFVGKYPMHNYADVGFAPYSPEWVRRRKLVHSLLKMYGEGSGQLENILHQELDILVREIRKSEGASLDLGDATKNVIHHAIGILVNIL